MYFLFSIHSRQEYNKKYGAFKGEKQFWDEEIKKKRENSENLKILRETILEAKSEKERLLAESKQKKRGRFFTFGGKKTRRKRKSRKRKSRKRRK